MSVLVVRGDNARDVVVLDAMPFDLAKSGDAEDGEVGCAMHHSEHQIIWAVALCTHEATHEHGAQKEWKANARGSTWASALVVGGGIGTEE